MNKNNAPYFIIEVASTHGGDEKYLVQLLNEFDKFRCGIKFQPYKYDLIAEADYPGFGNYQKLFFDNTVWKEILKQAVKTKDIWLDLFDEYSIQILNENVDLITGIKLQASVLGNYELLRKLSETNLDGKKCILNISGYEFSELEHIISDIYQIVQCEIIIQAGFQSHPTQFADSGLSKLIKLRNHFTTHKLSFADHLEHNSDDVLLLPFVAFLKGASIIEKHVKCEHLEAAFDGYSSITHLQFSELIDIINRYNNLLNDEYINQKERDYLKKSLLVPIIKNTKEKGQILGKEDFYYRRTKKTGLDSFTLFDKNNFYVLKESVEEGQALQQENIKKARIGAVVVCRMKSKRLPQKAIIDIGGISSVELCLKNALQFSNVDEVILATSTHPDDAVLENYTYNNQVKFFKGSEDDVIDRFITIAETHNLDIIIRFTGDSPYRSDEVLQLLLKSHFEKGADYTAAKNAAIGTNTEIINVHALKKVYKMFNGAPYSEYMSYYFKNNSDYFKINIVELPEPFNSSFRLTLDYPEDLELFKAIENKFQHANNPFDATRLFSFLESNPGIANLNAKCEVAYTPDSDLMKKIIEFTTYKN